MRGLRREPLAPRQRARAFRAYRGLALEPAQNVGGLNVLGALDVFTYLANAFLELRFERNRENWWWQSSCPLHGDLGKHLGQLVTILSSVFTSDQCMFRLKGSQGTPPV